MLRRLSPIFGLFVLIAPIGAGAELRSLFPNACVIELDPSAELHLADASAADLTRIVRAAVANGVLTPARLRAHYLGGIQGRTSREFISYLTRALTRDVFVAAVADGRRAPTADEAAFDRALNDLRKDALASVEGNATRHALLTDRWRAATKALSLELIGR